MFCKIKERQIGAEEIGKGDEAPRDTIIAIADEDLAGLPYTRLRRALERNSKAAVARLA
ncbi:hypothetical protein [Streptomyces sp. NPDC058695]|uniref:hypothetical protein n=1 Tax=Streptomyces sp. NPDC058695 TaxID=3346604 RepID=UPI0036497FA6